MADAAAFAQERGIKLVLKPHGGGSGASEEIRNALKAVGHPNFKIWYDAGNIIYYTGKDPVAEADRLCDVAAGAPAGSYIAWLSFTGEPVQTRLPDDVRWHLGNPGGPVVFASRADFVAGAAPTVAIDADSSNVRVVDDGGPTLAWTGSTANGLPSGQDCAKWVSGAPQGGRAGIVGDTTGKWTNAQTVTCAQSLHLYCFGR
mgnify:CR=1 FL=1